MIQAATRTSDQLVIQDGLIDLALAWNRRLVALPPDPRCAVCGMADPMVLHRDPRRRQKVLCYRCRQVRLGRSGTEEHHFGGRPSPLPPLPIEGNLHRILSYLQHPWRNAGIKPGSFEAVLWDLAVFLLLFRRWEPQ